ncbi:Protein of unknown function [Bosea sp. CRIB-10]|uniref:DUF998 domain-containing protein n=1 Tax=Bosea sp. CRIB-10 TaxID=378404 RepID=UPI0008E22B64|nr:DUF998 domain-containing protein [Bosea sp. CRIB-10]SFD03719.1 Protein of unknown function [Bosea sp. CRIB-10]
MQTAPSSLDRALLACGVASAPVFYGLAALQVALRPGYDIRTQPISFLALGELGWIQVANFVVTGALALAGALGLRHVLRGQRGGTAGPILAGLYGLGMIGAGLFGPDPLPAPGQAPQMSAAGAVHMVAFLLSFLSLIAACFVFARRFNAVGKSGWALYSVVTALVAPALVATSMANPAFAGLIVGAAGLVLFGWFSLIAFEVRNETSALPAFPPQAPAAA